MAEWLRRRPAKALGFPRISSNLIVVVSFCDFFNFIYIVFLPLLLLFFRYLAEYRPPHAFLETTKAILSVLSGWITCESAGPSQGFNLRQGAGSCNEMERTKIRSRGPQADKRTRAPSDQVRPAICHRVLDTSSQGLDIVAAQYH